MAYKSLRDADFPASLDLSSQRKWSSEIINEARNAMRAVDTRRPFTPQTNTRTLFGGTTRTHTGRPASQFSLRSLDLADSRPVSGLVKLQPIHGTSFQDVSGLPYRSLPKLPSLDFSSSGSFRRPSRRSSLGNLAEEPLNVEEEESVEIARQERKAFSGPKERTPHFPDLVSGMPETDLTVTSLDESQKAIRLPRRTQKSRTSSGRGLMPLPPPGTPPPPKKPPVAEVKKARLEADQDGEFLETRLQPMLDAIKGADPDAATETLKEVYAALEEYGYFSSQGSKKRTPVVRLLSPFVDHPSPKFLLQLARILLALKLRGNNLTNVWKLVFKIARSDKNDSLFLEDSILDLIVDSIGSLDPVEEAEPCIYAYGAIKFLTTNPNLLAKLNQAGILPLMILHLRLLAAEREAPSFPGKTTTTSSREQMGQVLYQLTGGFRNVVGGNSAVLIAQNGSLAHLASVAKLFVRDVDIVSNMARIFSVLAANEACCDAMGCAELRPLFLPVYYACLSKYPGRQDVVVRIAYVLGNMMAKRDETRMDYFAIDGAGDGLLDLLSIYVRKDIGGTAANASSGSRKQLGFTEKASAFDETQAGGDGSSGTPTDVIIKVIRVIANMSIGAKVGASMAGSHRCLDHLLAVVRHKEVAFGAELDSVARREDTEAVLSALATLNNLAYYSAGDQESAISQRATEVTEYLCDILLLGHREATIEVLRVLGNLTRNELVRDLLSNRRIFDFLIGVLDSDCREAVYSACGVLVNMMTDPTRRMILKDLDGISRLTAVLKEMGPCDWQLASLVVQVLWNACAGLEDPGDYLGDEEADALMDVVEDLLDIKDASALYAEFSVVANQFLDRLEGDDSVEE